jgi:hypothetical protein
MGGRWAEMSKEWGVVVFEMGALAGRRLMGEGGSVARKEMEMEVDWVCDEQEEMMSGDGGRAYSDDEAPAGLQTTQAIHPQPPPSQSAMHHEGPSFILPLKWHLGVIGPLTYRATRP